MKGKRFFALLMLSGIGIFGFTGGPAYATSADAQAGMSFTSITNATMNDGSMWTAVYAGGVSSWTYTYPPFPVATTNWPSPQYWGNTSAGTSGGTYASGSNATGVPIFAESKATGNSGKIDAIAGIGGLFTFNSTTDDTVTLTSTYNYLFNLVVSQLGESAFGKVIIDARVGYGDTYYAGSAYNLVHYEIPLNPNQNYITSGTLSKTVVDKAIAVAFPGFNYGDTGWFQATVEARAQTTTVPIPGAMWLLGSGLVGLVGIRRRFQK